MALYRRLTPRDRCQIATFLQAGLPVDEIAGRLSFHRASIYRELQRNQVRHSYDDCQAQRMTNQRFRCCRRHYKVTGHLEQLIIEQLREDWSPEQIAHRIRYEGHPSVSHPTIYAYVHRHRRILGSCLRRYNKRGAGRYRQRQIRDLRRTFIDQRPAIVDERQRLGDWERDGMYIADHQQLLVLTDRKSRFTKIRRLKSILPRKVTQITHAMLVNHPVLTVTNDNGPEFRDSHHLKYPVYHCHPRKPYERGTVENTIGLLRQYIKRDTSPADLSQLKLRKIQQKLNLRPRKCLDYKTPYEVFYNQSVALVT